MIKSILFLLIRLIVLVVLIGWMWIDRSDFALKILVSWLIVVTMGILSWMRKQSIRQEFHEVDTVYRLKQMAKKEGKK